VSLQNFEMPEKGNGNQVQSNTPSKFSNSIGVKWAELPPSEESHWLQTFAARSQVLRLSWPGGRRILLGDVVAVALILNSQRARAPASYCAEACALYTNQMKATLFPSVRWEGPSSLQR
jgi:hypothetical protein